MNVITFLNKLKSSYIRLSSSTCVAFLFVYSIVIYFNQDPLASIPLEYRKYLFADESLNSDLFKIDIDVLKNTIGKLNIEREVINSDKYRPIDQDTTVLLIQVHNDVTRLKILIFSLAQVRYIDKVLIIFSHSYYHETINSLVRSINFCKVMQIFYPYSIQLHPNKFPGVDLDDCRNNTRSNSKEKFCINRDAYTTEHKQHWWWKANFVFDRMQWVRHNGPVVFLEEDNYVLPDFLHMLQFLYRSMSYFPSATLMSLGGPFSKNLDTSLMTVRRWQPPFDIAIAFNKSTWKSVNEISSFYCMYDDSSWSYSFFNLADHYPGKMDMVGCVSPRVLSVKQFEPYPVERIKKMLRSWKMYPKKVQAMLLFGPEGRVDRSFKVPEGAGGWSDMRDQLLCLDTLMVTTEESDSTTTTTTRFD